MNDMFGIKCFRFFRAMSELRQIHRALPRVVALAPLVLQVSRLPRPRSFVASGGLVLTLRAQSISLILPQSQIGSFSIAQ